MKHLILILIIFTFAFSSCGKTDNSKINDTGSKKPDTEDDEFPDPIPINEVEDSLNPFKILGEVKSAKLVLYSILSKKHDYEIDIVNPQEWPKLLFAEYEDVNWECKYIFDIVFETSTGTHNVHLKSIQCELGDYEAGKTRLHYNFSPEFYDNIYKLIKSIVKLDQPHHKDNLIAGDALAMYFRHVDDNKYDEAIELMRSFLNGNDFEFDSRDRIEDRIKRHDRKQSDNQSD